MFVAKAESLQREVLLAYGSQHLLGIHNTASAAPVLSAPINL